MDRSIDVEKSKILKVIAVLMMIWVHLYANPDRIENVEYISIWVTKNGPIEQVVSTCMVVCIRIFLFVSGYGLYIKYKGFFKWEDAKNVLKKVYLNYIVIFLLFVPIGFLIGKYKFNIKELIMNLITVSNSYNGEWWFLNIYFLLIIIYVVGNKYVEKYNIKIILLGILLLNFIGMAVAKGMTMLNINSSLMQMIVNVLAMQISFYIGVLVAKYGLFDYLNNKFKIRKSISAIGLGILTLALIFKINIPVIDNYIYLVVEIAWVFLLINTISGKEKIIKLSKHTTNMWLTHSFFCYYLFQEIAFKPKYSMLVFIWVVILSLISSILINYILGGIKKYSLLGEKSIKVATKRGVN